MRALFAGKRGFVNRMRQRVVETIVARIFDSRAASAGFSPAADKDSVESFVASTTTQQISKRVKPKEQAIRSMARNHIPERAHGNRDPTENMQPLNMDEQEHGDRAPDRQESEQLMTRGILTEDAPQCRLAGA
jgi:hypothetical protein